MPISKSCIDQILDSNPSFPFAAPSEQEKLKTQTQNLFVEFQAGLYSRCHALLNPLIKLQMIKYLQAAKSHIPST